MNTKLTVGGDVSLNTKLTVVGDVSLNTKLTVGGDVSLNTKLTVIGDVSLNTKLTVKGDASFNSQVDVSGNLKVNSDASFNSKVDVSGNLNVINGDVSLNNKLKVGKDASFNSNVDVSGNLNVLYGDVSLNNKLKVGKDASFNSNVDIAGILTAGTFAINDISVNTAKIGDLNVGTGGIDCSGNVYIVDTTGTLNNKCLDMLRSPDNRLAFSLNTNNFSYNKLTRSGDNIMISGNAALATGNGLVIGSWTSSTNCGVRFTSSDIVIGSGGTTQNPTNRITFNNTNMSFDAGSETAIQFNRSITMNSTNYLERQIYTGYLNLCDISENDTQSTGTRLYQSRNNSYWDNSANTGNLQIRMKNQFGTQNIPMTITYGFIDISGNLNVNTGDVSLNKLKVSGDVSLNSKLKVGGDVSLNSKLTVSGDASFNSNVDIAGILTAGTIVINDISVNSAKIGDLKVGSSGIDCSGASNFDKPITMSSTISQERFIYTGHLYLCNSESTYDSSGTNIYQVGPNSYWDNDVSGGNLQIAVNNASDVQKVAMKIDYNIIECRTDVSINNTLTVNGDVSLNSKLIVGGDVSLNSKLKVVGDVSLNSKLTVSGDASFNSNVVVADNTATSAITKMFQLEQTNTSNRLVFCLNPTGGAYNFLTTVNDNLLLSTNGLITGPKPLTIACWNSTNASGIRLTGSDTKIGFGGSSNGTMTNQMTINATNINFDALSNTSINFNKSINLNNVGSYIKFPDGTTQSTAYVASTAKVYTTVYVSDVSLTMPSNCIRVDIRCVSRGGAAGASNLPYTGGSGGGGQIISLTNSPLLENYKLDIIFENIGNITSVGNVQVRDVMNPLPGILLKAFNGGNGGNGSTSAGTAGIASLLEYPTAPIMNSGYGSTFALLGLNGNSGTINGTYPSYVGIARGSTSYATSTNYGDGQLKTGDPWPTGAVYITYYLK